MDTSGSKVPACWMCRAQRCCQLAEFRSFWAPLSKSRRREHAAPCCCQPGICAGAGGARCGAVPPRLRAASGAVHAAVAGRAAAAQLPAAAVSGGA